MMRLLVLLFLISPFALRGQLQVNHTTFDFGNIASFNNDTAYFEFTNSGRETIFLLPVLPKDDYAVLCSNKTISPGSRMTIGIVYYTAKKGRFKINIPLYFSHLNSAFEISIQGNIKSIRHTAFSTCPSIENSVPLRAAQIPLNIVVKDLETKETLLGATVDVIKNKIKYKSAPDYSGSYYRSNVDYGLVNISAVITGYAENQIQFDYRKDHYYCVIFLDKIKDSLPIVENRIQIIEVEQPDTVFPELPVYIPVAYADSGFNSTLYKPNHLIFIVDISGSMKDSSKLYFLKRSMNALIAMIRPGDYITLITYTNKIKVVFENVSGMDRQSIYTAIDTLGAGGGSNGSKSLVIAYELAKLHFIENGNNQVFIATDGLLNSSSMSNNDLYKLASKAYRQDQIILSTIGFGKDENALDFLMRLAKSGRGHFLMIRNLDLDLEILLEEVKKQSRK